MFIFLEYWYQVNSCSAKIDPMVKVPGYSQSNSEDIFSIPFNSKWYSQLFLWIPIIGVFLCVFHYFSGTELPSVHRSVIRFVKNIILLDALHFAFTFGIMFGSTPGRELLLKKKKQLSSKKIWLFALFAIGFISLGNFIYFRKIEVAIVGGSFVFMFFWIWALAPTFHTMRQSYGIGLLVKKLGPWEKRILHASFALVIFALVLSQFSGNSYQVMTASLGALGLVCALGFLFYVYFSGGRANSTKFLFSIRFLLWPLMFFSPLATHFIVFLHGQEYLFTYAKILKSDKSKEARKQSLLISALFLLTIVPLCTLGLIMGLNNEDPWTGPLPVALVFSFLPLINLLHYLADSFIYRMRDSDVSLTIGKALH